MQNCNSDTAYRRFNTFFYFYTKVFLYYFKEGDLQQSYNRVEGVVS